MNTKITVTKVMDLRYQHCDCCGMDGLKETPSKLYEISFRRSEHRMITTTLCEQHLDELRREAFCAETGMLG